MASIILTAQKYFLNRIIDGTLTGTTTFVPNGFGSNDNEGVHRILQIVRRGE